MMVEAVVSLMKVDFQTEQKKKNVKKLLFFFNMKKKSCFSKQTIDNVVN